MTLKFKDFKYERCNYDQTKERYLNLLSSLESADSFETFESCFREINEWNSHISLMRDLSYVRDTIDKNDEFYKKEEEYWNEYEPRYQELQVEFYKRLLESPWKEELGKKLPTTYFPLLENELKGFAPEIIEDLVQENQWKNRYNTLIANAKIEFRGNIYNLQTIHPFTLSPDRATRKEAKDAIAGFMAQREDDFDEIYDQLVKIRDRMAKKLGYSSFVELGYILRNRLDYDQEMVETYREQVLKYIVPVSNKLIERQKERLGLEHLTYYDAPFEFESGNPTPKGSPKDLVEAAKQMYSEMSQVTGEFFNKMVDQDLMDLVSKPGKEAGGYCIYFGKPYQMPFIFSNFNGTSGDVDVLTHEAGHALQDYLSKDIYPAECIGPTYETAEVHSMSMEFFAWPWMEKFFGADAKKYYYTHLGGAVKFVPYGILIDHFQHEVYNHPEMTKEERKACFRKLEKQYLPKTDYTGCEIWEKGTWWYRQNHVFNSPFYYIDYTLAQVCAFQFWKRMQDQDPQVWDDYVKLCSLGGTETFTKAITKAGLKSPFEEGCLEEVMKAIDEYLSAIDDKKL